MATRRLLSALVRQERFVGASAAPVAARPSMGVFSLAKQSGGIRGLATDASAEGEPVRYDRDVVAERLQVEELPDNLFLDRATMKGMVTEADELAAAWDGRELEVDRHSLVQGEFETTLMSTERTGVELPIVSLQRAEYLESGPIVLDPRVFQADIRPDLAVRVARWMVARRKKGTNKTKTKGEIAVSGKKLRPQKGTGNARMRTRAAPQFKGGYKAMGQHRLRNGNHELPMKVRHAAARTVLSSKALDQRLHVWEDVAVETLKTRELTRLFNTLDVGDGRSFNDVTSIVVHADDEDVVNFRLAARGLRNVMPVNHSRVNAYDLLRFEHLVLTKAGAEALTERLAKTA